MGKISSSFSALVRMFLFLLKPCDIPSKYFFSDRKVSRQFCSKRERFFCNCFSCGIGAFIVLVPPVFFGISK